MQMHSVNSPADGGNSVEADDQANSLGDTSSADAPESHRHHPQRSLCKVSLVVAVSVMAYLMLVPSDGNFRLAGIKKRHAATSLSPSYLTPSSETDGTFNTIGSGTHPPPPSGPSPQAVPIIVLKNGRSGSTWFRDLLNRKPYGCIKKEIITKSLGKKMTLTDKLNNITGVMNSFEQRDDCRELYGVTACPFLKTGVIQPDFMDVMRELRAAMPDVRVVVFSRSNVFRTSIASHGTKGFARKEEKREECRSMGRSCCRVSFPLENFECDLPHRMKYHEQILELGNALRYEGFPVRTVLFEELKADPRAMMESVADWLGLSSEATSMLAQSTGHRILRRELYNLTTKPMVDLVEFDEYVEYLSSLPSPGRDCLLEQLHLPDNVVSPVCLFPYESSADHPDCGAHVNPSYECQD